MEGLTINEAARTTGWSPRMLRYVEQTGLVSPARSASGYRLYGPAQLQRLRTLKELLARFDVGLSDVAFAARMAESPVRMPLTSAEKSGADVLTPGRKTPMPARLIAST